MTTPAENALALRLFQLQQRPVEILRVQEQHGLAVGADFGLAVAKNPRAGRDEPVARR